MSYPGLLGLIAKNWNTPPAPDDGADALSAQQLGYVAPVSGSGSPYGRIEPVQVPAGAQAGAGNPGATALGGAPATVQPNLAPPTLSPSDLAAIAAGSIGQPIASPALPSSWAGSPAQVPGAAGLGNVQPIPASVLRVPDTSGYFAGNAPDPAEYAKRGEIAKGMMTPPSDPTAGSIYDLSQLAQFKRGWPLDAQVMYGGNPAYANYVFGVYNAAAGHSLDDAKNMANIYAGAASNYKNNPQMDKIYSHTPAANIANITQGYNDYLNRTLWKKS